MFKFIKNKTARALVSFAFKWGIVALAIAIALTRFLAVRICRSNDMYPNVRDGDFVLLKRFGTLLPDDVILYEHDGKEFYGRIVALAGEEVEITENGLYVDGSQTLNALPYETIPQEGQKYPLTVPDGCFFVLGDLRSEASDSRIFGCVSEEDVIGKQIYLMRWRNF